MISKHWLIAVLKISCLVAFYYLTSIGITFYNQNFVHHFNFPLTLTLCHFIVKFLMSGFVRTILMWKAVAGSIDIGLSNWSFEYVTISLYTMTKSSAILFILFFSILFKVEKPRWSTGALVILIAGGLFLFTYRSSQFSTGGFILVLIASCLSGIRWSLTQLVMQKAEIGLSNPLDMMYHIQPFMAISILPLAVGNEGIDFAISPDFFAFGIADRDSGVSVAILLILVGSLLAFMLELAEFLLVFNTSSLTLSISGIFKELCTLLLASYFKNDPISPVNWIGVALCLCGISLHTYVKFRQGRRADGNVGADEQEMAKFSSPVLNENTNESVPLIGAGANGSEAGEESDGDADGHDNLIFSAGELRPQSIGSD